MSDAAPPPPWHRHPLRRRRIAVVAAVATLTVIADLWTKAWAWDRLREGEPITLIEHWLYLRFGFNTGSAFSFLDDAEWSRAFFIGITLLALGYMAWLTHKMPTRRAYGFWAVGLIAGGALGNLHDRFVRQLEVRLDGEVATRYGVVDFIQFFYDWEGGRYWPIFNVADSALVIGVGLLLVYMRGQDGSAKTGAGG